MGIEAKHSYWFGYLKSEQWQTVRIEALAREKGRCQICSIFSPHNDAHHIEYPSSIWDTKSDHLVIVCRPCHNLIHSILETHSLKSHSLMQFQQIRDIMMKWKSSQEDNGHFLIKEIPVSDPNHTQCSVCRNSAYDLGRLIFYEKFNFRKLKICACKDCRASAALVVASMDELPAEKWKIYERWKKSRRPKHTPRVDV